MVLQGRLSTVLESAKSSPLSWGVKRRLHTLANKYCKRKPGAKSHLHSLPTGRPRSSDTRVGLQERKKETYTRRTTDRLPHTLPSRCFPLSTHTHTHTPTPHLQTPAGSLTPRSPSRPTLAHLQTLTRHTLFSCRLLTPALSSGPLCTISPLQSTLALFQATQLHRHTSEPAHASRTSTPAAPAPSDSAPELRERGESGTHRLRVQAGRSPGSAASPRPPQSSESPAQVQAAGQGARGPAAAVAGSSRNSSSSSSHRRRRPGRRRGAPSAPRTGRAILSGARGELRARGLRGPGRPRRRRTRGNSARH